MKGIPNLAFPGAQKDVQDKKYQQKKKQYVFSAIDGKKTEITKFQVKIFSENI